MHFLAGKGIQSNGIKSTGEKTRSEPTPEGVRPLRITGSATPKRYQKATSAGKAPGSGKPSPTGTAGADGCAPETYNCLDLDLQLAT
jgi:hypothetical protein